jgi:TolB-like protein/Tfp pilus assembly protein PilF
VLAGVALLSLLAVGWWGWKQAIRAPVRSIAVLPLENLSGDPEQEYFSDGMTEAVITEFARIRSLRVISRTSVMQYKGARKPLPEIASELDVQGIVEGSVLRAGDRVRITLQLIDARNDHHLWAESYERELSDVLGLQGEIARAVAREVALELSPEEEALLRNERSVDPDAHDAYLRGTMHLAAFTAPDSFKAVDYFEQALEIDPEFAEAWAGLADAYAFLGYGNWAVPANEARARGLAAADRALELDPSLGHAHAARGLFLALFERNWDEAEVAMRRALELGPSDALVNNFYGSYMIGLGRPRDALPYMEKAIAASPLSLRLRNDLGWALYNARDYNGAVDVFLQVLEVDPDFPAAHLGLVDPYSALGREADAMHAALDWFRVTGLLNGEERDEYERLYRQNGPLAARRFHRDVSIERTRTAYVSPAMIAWISAPLDDRDTTFYWLERAFEEGSPLLTAELSTAYPLDPIRDDPRFRDLMRRMNYPQND